MRVTSTRRTGSQKPMGIPGTGGTGRGGRGQKHGIVLEFSVSSHPPVLTLTPPIESGNKQDQQISVRGLTNRPGYALVSEEERKILVENTHIRKQ